MIRPAFSSAYVCVILFCAFTLLNAQSDWPFKNDYDQRGLEMNWIEKKIKEKIESFREVLRKGDPAFGIPVLDPYSRDNEEIKVNTSLVSVLTDIKDFSVVGLSGYSVDDVRLSLKNMSGTIRLSWTGIKAKGYYNLNGDLNIPYTGKAPLYGNGTARGLVYKIWVEGKIRFGVEDDVVKASDLNLSWEIINPQVRVDGLFGGLELGNTINQIVEDIIPKLDAAYHEKVQTTLQEKGLKFINDYLSGIKNDGDDSYMNLLQLLR